MKNIKDIKTVIFPVAGLGTRFFPATKTVAKELLPVLDKPIIEYAVEEAKMAGIEKFVFVLSENKKQILNHFATNKKLEQKIDKNDRKLLELIKRQNIHEKNICTVKQNKQLGLGHAIWCARRYIDGPFAVILPDDLVFSKKPCIKQLIEIYYKLNKPVIAIKEVSKEQVVNYGIIDTIVTNKRVMPIKNLVEKPDIKTAPSNLAVIGRYILFPSIIKELSKKRIGSGNEIQLTDAIKSSLNYSEVYGYKFEGNRFDCGKVIGSIEAQIYAALHNNLYKKDILKILKDFIKEV